MYDELRENMPDVGEIVTTPEGDGKVISIQLIQRNVRVIFREGNAVTYNIKDIKRNETSRA